MKITKKHIGVLKDMGVPYADIPQIVEAARYARFERSNKIISARTVFETCADRKILDGLWRAAFHWTSTIEATDGFIFVDCSEFFRQYL